MRRARFEPGTSRGSPFRTERTERTFAGDDRDSSRKLVIGISSLERFRAPIDLANCEFRGSEVPTADDFQLTVEDAADVASAPATATVGVTVVPAP